MAGSIELHALQALHGDSFILKYTDAENEPSHLLIDGGPPAAWAALRKKIEKLAEEVDPLTFRLCVLTHVDEDHVGGLLKFFKYRSDHPNEIGVTEVWMNAFPSQDKPKTVEAREVVKASVAQGNELLTLVRQQDILFNHYPSLTDEDDGITATVVAPETAALARLAKTWGKTASIEAAIAAYKDTSVFNRSSIVLLIEKGGAKLLMCGDARGDDILKGLENTKKLDKYGVLALDLLKIPHHGGEHNTAPDFYKRLPAKNYLISTDGAKFPHPHPSMLADLFAARKAAFPNDPFKILLTYGIDELGEKADVPGIRKVIAKAKADGLDFTVSKIDGPLTF